MTTPPTITITMGSYDVLIRQRNEVVTPLEKTTEALVKVTKQRDDAIERTGKFVRAIVKLRANCDPEPMSALQTFFEETVNV